MTTKLHVYDGGGITVTFDTALCIHNGHCVRNLPAVFNTAARPWVQPDNADSDMVFATVAGCPSGALRAARADGTSAESLVSADTLAIHAMPNGPLFVRGDLTILDGDGTTIATASRAALCRCGHSAHKPYCDNSHRTAAWRDVRPTSE